MKQTRQLLTDMMIGLGIWGIAVLIVLEILAHNKLAAAGGVLVGILTAVWLIFHMCRHLDIALDMDSGHAQRHVQLAAMKRFVVMGAVLAASMIWYQYFHPVGTVLGMFGVKICALMQPQVHRLRQGKENK